MSRRKMSLLWLGLVLASPARGASLGESDLRECRLERLETRAHELVVREDASKAVLRDGLDSFALKVLVPHLLRKKVLFAEELVVCKTYRDESLDDWAGCLKRWLEPKEAALFEAYRACLAGAKAGA